MWDIKLKFVKRYSNVGLPEGRRCGVEVAGLIYGDRSWFDFRRWAHRAIYRPSVIEMYTLNLYDPINQYHPNKFNFSKFSIK